jgi:hypothetical protein
MKSTPFRPLNVNRYKIEVRRYLPGQTDHSSECIGAITGDYGKFEVVETIHRKPWAEQIGNFNPLFCRYKGKRTLMHSDAGDLSDPFRRSDTYAQSFFITV